MYCAAGPSILLYGVWSLRAGGVHHFDILTIDICEISLGADEMTVWTSLRLEIPYWSLVPRIL